MRKAVGIAITSIALMGFAPAGTILATGSASAKSRSAHAKALRHRREVRCRRWRRHHHGRRPKHCRVLVHRHRATNATIASANHHTNGPAHRQSGQTGNSSGAGNASWSTSGPAASHIATWAYDDGCNGGSGASQSLVQQWLSFAESNCGPDATKAVGDCQSVCTTLAYLNTNKIYNDSVPIAQDAQEGWWLHAPGHADAAHRLRIPDYGGGQLLDDANPAVRSWFKNYVTNGFNSFDGLMMDDTNSSLTAELYESQSDTSDEITSNNALDSAHEAMANALTHANGSPMLQVDNTLNVNPYLRTPFKMLGDTSTVHGLVAEGVPESDGQMVGYFPTMLDDMAYIDHTAHDFIALLSYDQNGALVSRRVQAASVLLGYAPGHTVSWSDLEQNSGNLAVWPEEGIVPNDPVQTMAQPGGDHCLDGTGPVCSTGGHNDLQVADGVFRREFGSCSDKGQSFGKCAVIVNTTGSSITVKGAWLTQSYNHVITMHGGDVQSGGTIDVNGSAFNAGGTTVGPHDALLIAS
jgi:hypothetical protein